MLEYLRPYVSLYKVDLKSFRDRPYRDLGGTLERVLWTIRALHEQGFWVEVVTLVVPGFNDSTDELRDIARFLVSVSPDIPWHVTAFHPDYRMTDRAPTTVSALLRAAEIGAAEGLHFVYAGNLPGAVRSWENTLLPGLPRPARRAARLPRAAQPPGRGRPLPRLPPGRARGVGLRRERPRPRGDEASRPADDLSDRSSPWRRAGRAGSRRPSSPRRAAPRSR